VLEAQTGGEASLEEEAGERGSAAFGIAGLVVSSEARSFQAKIQFVSIKLDGVKWIGDYLRASPLQSGGGLYAFAARRAGGAGESLEHSTAQGIAKTAAALLFLVQRIVPGSQSQRTADPGEAGMRDIQALHIKAIPTLHQQYFSVLDQLAQQAFEFSMSIEQLTERT
jgi:hypothetical protein